MEVQVKESIRYLCIGCLGAAAMLTLLYFLGSFEWSFCDFEGLREAGKLGLVLIGLGRAMVATLVAIFGSLLSLLITLSLMALGEWMEDKWRNR